MGRISVPVVWCFKMLYFIIALGVFDFLLLQGFFFNVLVANRLPHTPTKCHILHLEAYWSNVSVHRNSPSLPLNPFTFFIFCSLCQWHLGIGMVGKEQTLDPGCSGKAIEEEVDERSLNLLLSLLWEEPQQLPSGLADPFERELLVCLLFPSQHRQWLTSQHSVVSGSVSCFVWCIRSRRRSTTDSMALQLELLGRVQVEQHELSSMTAQQRSNLILFPRQD